MKKLLLIFLLGLLQSNSAISQPHCFSLITDESWESNGDNPGPGWESGQGTWLPNSSSGGGDALDVSSPPNYGWEILPTPKGIWLPNCCSLTGYFKKTFTLSSTNIDNVVITTGFRVNMEIYVNGISVNLFTTFLYKSSIAGALRPGSNTIVIKAQGSSLSTSWIQAELYDVKANTPVIYSSIDNLPITCLPPNEGVILTAPSGITDWHWYEGSCGGTPVGTGSSITVNPSSTTTYYARGENGCFGPGNCGSKIVTFNNVAGVSITSNATSNFCYGTNITFNALATSGSGLNYQWKINGADVGSNAATYSNAALLNNDVVTCVVSNSCNTATSNPLTMSVSGIPSSVTISMFQNQSTTICQGGYAAFTAVGTNSGAHPTFKWKRNGVVVETIPNSFDNTSFYQTFSLSNNDVITCEMISQLACTLPSESNGITMTVNPVNNPSVSIDITSGTNPDCSGEPLTFTATPTNGGTTPTYEWHRIAYFPAINTVVGTNSPVFILESPAHNDIIYCVMTSSIACSSPVNSNSITVKAPTVLAGYINCNANCNGSAVTSTCGAATIEFSAVSWNVINGGYNTNNSPSYQWKLNGNNVGTNSSTYSQTGFTNGDVITCDVVSTEPCSTPASLTLAMTVSVYDVSSATLSVDGPAQVCSGTLPTYTANATNAGLNPSYQWKKNGLDVGANENTYTPDAIAVNDVITCVLTTDPVCAAPVPVPSGNSITITTIIPSVVPSIIISASQPIYSTTNTFTATITNGGSNPNFYWYKNNNYMGSGNSYFDAALAAGDIIYCDLTSNAPCANPSTITSNQLTVVAIPAYCTPSSNQGNLPCDYVWLTNVQMGTSTTSLNKSTVCDGFYSNFTATDTLNAAAGETVSYDIGSGGSSNWFHRQAVYIDFNNDKDFDDAGETVMDTYSGANINNTGTFALPSPLAKGSYRMRVIASNDIDFSPCNTNGGEAEDYTLQIGYCTPHTTFNATPCQSFYLANVAIGTGINNSTDINNSTGCDGFYSDFSASQIVSAAAGHTLTYSLTQGSVDAQNWSSSANIYIDYNNDGDFADAGELVISNIYLVYGDPPATGSFTLPQLLNYGSYRIRIVNSNTPENTCEIDYGEAEDYTLQITEPVYCIPVISQPCDMWIANTTIGSINNTTQQPTACTAGGYTDYSATQSTTAAPGSLVNYSLTALGNNYQNGDIYIDYNNDGDFDDADETVATNIFLQYNGDASTGSFTIPADKPYGYYRMRVKSYNNQESQTGPCGDNTNGDVEDYRLIINCVPNGSTAMVQGNNTDIADGDNTPNIADSTDFGNVEAGANLSRTYTIKNTGTGPLQITGLPTVSGGFFYYFAVTNSPSSYLLQPGESTSFTVQVSMPLWAINYPINTTLHVPTDNCDKKDYDFAISATGVPATCTPHSWTSTANNGNWNDPANWCDGVVPSATDDITIPADKTPYPVLNANASVHNLEIQSGATVTLGGHTLTINGAVTGNGTIDATAASGIATNASTTLLFSPTGHTLTSLSVNNGTLTLGNALDISADGGTVTVAAGATLASAGNLTLKSNQFGTARIAQGDDAGNYVTGNVTIERYIPNNGFRSWRLLSVPTHSSGQTIRQAWQEGDANPLPQQNNLAGYGTQITGTGSLASAQAAGFDNVAAAAALLTWNVNSWAAVTSTNTAIDNKKAYFLYLRGERSKGVTGAVTNSSATTLRTTGNVYTGDQSTSIPTNAFTLVANVYPSAINFTGLQRNNVANLFYIWDSKKLNGSSLGVYQTFSATNSFNCLISGGSYVQGQPNTIIESGQGFFVQGGSLPGGGSIILKESSKTNGSTGLGFRPSGAISKVDIRLHSNGEMMDAATVVFNNNYSNEVDNDDAPKLGNPGENICIQKQNTSLLAIEGKMPATDGDIIQLRIWNLKQQAYKLEAMPQQLPAGVIAFIEDHYLKTSTPVDMSNGTTINFAVDGNAASYAANRFRIVFGKTKPIVIEAAAGYSITPNPVESGVATLLFKNKPQGKYSVRIISAAGQTVLTKQIAHSGGSAAQSILLPAGMGNGLYKAEITGPDKLKETISLMVNKN